MADPTLTPAQAAAVDATVARVRAERADAQIMGARYDAVCERLVELEDETAAQRRRIAELEHEAGSAVGTAGALRARVLELEMRENARNERIAELEALTGRLRLAWTSARRRARQQRDALREAMAADRDQARLVRDRYRDERNAARAEIADLRAQLAATTNPDRALDRLAADARPAGGGR